MNHYKSFLLASIFMVLSNADYCITASENSDGQVAGAYGNYVEESAGIYKRENFCPMYLYQKYGSWKIYNQKDSTTSYVRCEQETSLPTQCSTWLNGVPASADGSVSVSTTSCSPPSDPVLECGAMEIDIAGANYYSDGTYSKTGTNLYELTAGGQTYKFQFYKKGGEYIKAYSDYREQCDASISTVMKVSGRDLDGISVGQSMTVTTNYGSATFTCLANAGSSSSSGGGGSSETTTTSGPSLGSGSICVSRTSAISGSFGQNGGPMITYESAAGQYSKISDVNGRAAYQLSCSGGTRYIAYMNEFARYMMVLDVNDYTTYVAFCNTGDMNNPLTCGWSNTNLQVSNTQSPCGCGQVSSGALNVINNINIPNESNKGFWSGFMNLVETQTMSVLLMWIFVMMCGWSILMCGYHCGYKKGTGFVNYSPAKAFNDEV